MSLHPDVCHCYMKSMPGALLIWIMVGQGPTALTVGVGRGCLDLISLIYHFWPNID